MINRLPFKINKFLINNDNYKIFIDESNSKYIVLKLEKNEYITYIDILKYCNKISRSIYEIKEENFYYLVFDFNDDLSETKVKYIRLMEVLLSIFDKSSYEVTLKKKNINNLNNLYRILDSKFTYFEFRIREVETAIYKDDISWIILSKYNIILDAKVFLYDLQQDIFNFIDKEEIVKYGIIYKEIDEYLYKNSKIMPVFNLYYGPVSMLYVRYFLKANSYLDIEDFKKKIYSLDTFNQKYFCFMVLYIYILNLNMEINFNRINISNYLAITKLIKIFINQYSEMMKK